MTDNSMWIFCLIIVIFGRCLPNQDEKEAYAHTVQQDNNDSDDNDDVQQT